MSVALYNIKRILISHKNGLLSVQQVSDSLIQSADKFGSPIDAYSKIVIEKLMLKGCDEALDWVVSELYTICEHTWYIDEIELPDESIQKVKYCCHCENAFK